MCCPSPRSPVPRRSRGRASSRIGRIRPGRAVVWKWPVARTMRAGRGGDAAASPAWASRRPVPIGRRGFPPPATPGTRTGALPDNRRGGRAVPADRADPPRGARIVRSAPWDRSRSGGAVRRAGDERPVRYRDHRRLRVSRSTRGAGARRPSGRTSRSEILGHLGRRRGVAAVRARCTGCAAGSRAWRVRASAPPALEPSPAVLARERSISSALPRSSQVETNRAAHDTAGHAAEAVAAPNGAWSTGIGHVPCSSCGPNGKWWITRCSAGRCSRRSTLAESG